MEREAGSQFCFSSCVARGWGFHPDNGTADLSGRDTDMGLRGVTGSLPPLASCHLREVGYDQRNTIRVRGVLCEVILS